MSYPFPPDLQRLVDLQLAGGTYLNEDEVLRDALRALAEEDEDLEAVREAIADWKAGDEGIPLAEACDQIRREVDGEPDK